MSTTTNLKLFKHDNPTTNTNQFDVEKALNENWDKVDKNAGEVASKIQTLENTTSEKDTSQDTEIEVLKAENALLKSQIPSATVVGETVHLEDSSNMQCQIMPLGASIQEGTPSIDSEAPIESVGDNINVLPNKATTQTINGVVFTVNSDGTVIANGTATANTNLTVAQNIALNDEEEYILSGCPTGGSDTKYAITMNQYYSSASHFTQDYGKGASFTYNKLSSTSNSVYIRIVSGATVKNLIFKPKISKKAGAYSPYGQGSVEIYNHNENLFDKTKTSTPIGSASGYVSTEYIPAVTGDTIAKSNATSLFLYDKTKTQITNVGNWTSKVIDIENVAYVRCNVLETDVDTFMLVKNQDLPSEYIQGRSQTKAIYTQQPFRAIGYEKDRFVKQNGVWYEEHNIEKVVLDKTQEIKKGTASEQINTIYLTMQYANSILSTRDINCMCENLQSYSGSFMWANDVEGIGQSSSQIVFRISKEKVTTLEEAKTFIENNPITVHVKRAEPLLIPCTPEQVEVLENFNTYKNVTNISSDSIGELEVFYYKDLETLLGGA